MCPTNKVGTVDLYMVSHHGTSPSGSPALVRGLQPRAAVMQNGTRKGAALDAMATMRTTPSLEDIWQLHWSYTAGIEQNSAGVFVANVDDNATIAAALTAPAAGRWRGRRPSRRRRRGARRRRALRSRHRRRQRLRLARRRRNRRRRPATPPAAAPPAATGGAGGGPRWRRRAGTHAGLLDQDLRERRTGRSRLPTAATDSARPIHVARAESSATRAYARGINGGPVEPPAAPRFAAPAIALAAVL